MISPLINNDPCKFWLPKEVVHCPIFRRIHYCSPYNAVIVIITIIIVIIVLIVDTKLHKNI